MRAEGELRGDIIAWVCSLELGRPASVEMLTRGAGSRMYRVRLEPGSGSGMAILVRCYCSADWLRREPDLAVREGAMLQFARSAGLPVPEVLGVRESPLPMVAMSALPGHPPPFAAYSRDQIASAASAAVAIHSIGAPVDPAWAWPAYAPHYLGASLEIRVPHWTADPAAWRNAIAAYFQFRPTPRACLLHRDFHMGNLLYRGGALTGIVDWVTSCFGDPSGDIAHMRWNLLLDVGDEAVAVFMAEYCSRLSYVHNPAYDIYAVVGALPDMRAPDGRSAERLDRFIRQAIVEAGFSMSAAS